MNLLKTAATVSGLTFLSRITGLVREVLTASLFGAGAQTDAFFVAFRLPNLLRRLFAEGAFSQAFVPVLGQVKTQDGDDPARLLATRVGPWPFYHSCGHQPAGHSCGTRAGLADDRGVLGRQGAVRAHRRTDPVYVSLHPAHFHGGPCLGRFKHLV